MQARLEARRQRQRSADLDLVYKDNPHALVSVPVAQDDQGTWAQWDAWCDARIFAALERFAEIVGGEIGETEKALLEEIAALRELTRSLASGKAVELLPRRRGDDAA